MVRGCGPGKVYPHNSGPLAFASLFYGRQRGNTLAGTKTPPFRGAKMARGRPSALSFQIPQRDSWSPDGVGNMVKRDPMRSLKKKCDKNPIAVLVGSNTDCLGCH